MPDTCLSKAVNKHFLERLLTLSATKAIVATEDIVDEHGSRVLARGTRMDAAHADALSGRTLKRGLETSLLVADAVSTDLIVTAAARLIDTSEPMSRILRATSGSGPSPLTMLSEMQFCDGTRMLLSLADNDSPLALEHAVCVSLLSMCMAKRLHLPEDDQRAAGLAGVLHDIGELFIEPAWLAPGKRLRPHEWTHLVGHPRIGQLLINELESYPLAVGRAVAEHHERFDGTGYPRQVVGHHISAPGQAVAVAEMIAGVITKDSPLERAELALKIVPGEHARDLLAAVSGALRHHGRCHVLGDEVPTEAEGAQRLFWRISSALETGQNLLDGTAVKSPRAHDMLGRALERIKTIQRAFVSTGLDAYLKHNHGLHDDSDNVLLFEKEVATREIQWRLRDIARDIALHTAASPDEKSVFACLIQLLDDDSDSELDYTPKAAPLMRLVARAPAALPGAEAYAN